MWRFLMVLTLLAAPAQAATPEQLYQQHCLTCHGSGRMGAMAPALLPQSLDRLRPQQIEQLIRSGRTATQMAGFADRLNEDEIRALTQWLLQPPAQAPKWDAADITASHVIHHQPDPQARLPASIDPLNLFVVVEAGDHHLSVVDGDRFRVLARVPTRYALHGGPKFSPDGRFVYLASRDGWVSQFDLYTQQMVAEVRVALNTRNVAVSSDGRWVLAGNTLPETLVLLDANGLRPVRTLPVCDARGNTSRVSAVYDAAPRNSFVVALKDVPELWEISYDPKAGKIYPAFVHDYKMGEGFALDGYLNPRVTALDGVLDDFFFDPSYRYVFGASRDGRAQVINLDIRRKLVDLPLVGMPHLGSGITFERSGRTLMASPDLKGGQIDVVDLASWQAVAQIKTPGPGFFLRSHERTPYAWTDSMMSKDARDTITLIDKRTLAVVKTLRPRPGRTTAHVEFTRDGRYVLLSVMETPGELLVLDADSGREVASLPMMKPIGKYNVYNKINRSEGTSH
ncbi:nitrite reductase [Crenobacter caeni]|uniref:Cytochrome C oxidase Cbb3 n=1 Tax=Crenobacter caeni TaxID=2705474 RepID=A0A6B2KVA5_9NEIS|nr:nitrite reductase [Crenobacter caeni]NDV14044.1 cytochrome C oxidase Cbb3 [Crenobacter caeni]